MLKGFIYIYTDYNWIVLLLLTILSSRQVIFNKPNILSPILMGDNMLNNMGYVKVSPP